MAKRKNTENCSENQDHISNGFNDLPMELIREILLRLSIKQLGNLSCVSKQWQTIIYDRSFAKFHLQNSRFSTRRCLFVLDFHAYAEIVDLDSVFHLNSDSAMGSISLPFSPMKRKIHPRVHLIGSCNGLVCLHREPYSLTVWNPTTGSYKVFSYYRHIVRNSYPLEKTWNCLKPLRITLLSGFGYDESKDDYLVIAAWKDKKEENHFDFYSLRSHSWKSFDVALPNNTTRRRDPGLFFNGALHWLPEDINDDKILVFDITKKRFSVISKPEKDVISYHAKMMVLGGCLALYFTVKSSIHGKIWIMKEYKVHKSWTLYKNPKGLFQPLCVSSDGNLVGLSGNSSLMKARANVERELSYASGVHVGYHTYEDHKSIMYTQSFMPLPSEKKKKKREGM
ncbi:hypothetical protein S83_049116 [Arachis hypogaea]